MKKSLYFLLFLALCVMPVWADDFEDEDLTFDESGEAVNGDDFSKPETEDFEADDAEAETEDEGETAANPANTGAAENTSAGEEAKEALVSADKEGAGALSEKEAEAATKTPAFKCPTWKEYSQRLHAKGGSDRVISTFSSKINMKDQKDIDSLYKFCRSIDVKLLQKGASSHASRLTSAMKGIKMETAESDHFLAAYPAKCRGLKDGKNAELATAEYYGIEKILSAADQAFENATEALIVKDFINWSGKVKAKMFFVLDPNSWQVLKGGKINSPVRTVYIENGYREFYVYLTPKNIPWNAEAVAYAVAEEVLNEFLFAFNRKGRVNDVLRVGFAAHISGLTSVITESGPLQVSRFQGNPVTYEMLVKLKESGTQLKSLPLEKSALISVDMLTNNGLPSEDGKCYYFLRQSAALVEYLNIRDALPLTYLYYKSFRPNRRFDEDYDNYFSSLHRDAFMGKKTDLKDDKDKKKEKKDDAKGEEDKEDSEDIGSNYKTFRNRVPALVFYPLTTDAVAKDIKESKEKEKEKEKNSKDKKAKRSDGDEREARKNNKRQKD